MSIRIDDPKIQAAVGAKETSDFTAADWVLLALAALDQADVSPRQLADAYRHARGKDERVLDELDLEGA